MIDYIRQILWSIFRRLPLHLEKEKDNRPFLCKIGWHKIVRGFGWTNDKRFDVCCNCKFHKWYKIKGGK